MASAITGTVSSLVVSGVTLTGASGELGEATITLGKQRGKFDPVGTDVSMHTTGMKTVEGSMTKRWTSGAVGSASRVFQEIIDGNDEFSVVMSATSGGSITVTTCIAGDRTVRTAPGTEVMMETLTFTGVNWS